MPGTVSEPFTRAVCAPRNKASASRAIVVAPSWPCDANTAYNTRRCDVKRRRPDRLINAPNTSPDKGLVSTAEVVSLFPVPLFCISLICPVTAMLFLSFESALAFLLALRFATRLLSPDALACDRGIQAPQYGIRNTAHPAPAPHARADAPV